MTRLARGSRLTPALYSHAPQRPQRWAPQASFRGGVHRSQCLRPNFLVCAMTCILTCLASAVFRFRVRVFVRVCVSLSLSLCISVMLQACSGELMSHNTYANIVKNKSNIDYCIDQFSFISNRIKCIKLMTGGGPFLA